MVWLPWGTCFSTIICCIHGKRGFIFKLTVSGLDGQVLVKHVEWSWKWIKRMQWQPWNTFHKSYSVLDTCCEGRLRWKKTAYPLFSYLNSFSGSIHFQQLVSYSSIHNFERALETFKVKGVKNERRLLLLLLYPYVLCLELSSGVFSFFSQ